MSHEMSSFEPIGMSEASTPDTFSELPSPTKPTLQFQVHPRYYLKDDMMVLLVEDKMLFRVHRHILDRESEIFHSYPSGTDEDPVLLPDVLSEEFEVLIEYLYDSLHGDETRSRKQWGLLLSVSTRFKMEKIRNRTIKELGNFNLDPVDRVVLAVEYDIPDWLKPAYIDLCRRVETIREEEAEKLGLGITVKLARAREKAREFLRSPIRICTSSGPSTPVEFFGASPLVPEVLDTGLRAAQVEPAVTEAFRSSSASSSTPPQPHPGTGVLTAKEKRKKAKVAKRAEQV